MFDEIERAPVSRGRGTEYEQVRAGVVGDELRRADDGEVVVAGVGDFDGRMKRVDGRQHLLNAVRLWPRVERLSHAECELGLRDPHVIGAKGKRCAVLKRPLAQQPPGQRTIHVDVLLSSGARRGDLPSEQRCLAPPLELRLNGVALRARGGAKRVRKLREPPTLLPVLPEQARRRRRYFST